MWLGVLQRETVQGVSIKHVFWLLLAHGRIHPCKIWRVQRRYRYAVSEAKAAWLAMADHLSSKLVFRYRTCRQSTSVKFRQSEHSVPHRYNQAIFAVTETCSRYQCHIVGVLKRTGPVWPSGDHCGKAGCYAWSGFNKCRGIRWSSLLTFFKIYFPI